MRLGIDYENFEKWFFELDTDHRAHDILQYFSLDQG